jgi:hypothetical protein
MVSATPPRAKLFHEEPEAGKLHIRIWCSEATSVISRFESFASSFRGETVGDGSAGFTARFGRIDRPTQIETQVRQAARIEPQVRGGNPALDRPCTKLDRENTILYRRVESVPKQSEQNDDRDWNTN